MGLPYSVNPDAEPGGCLNELATFDVSSPVTNDQRMVTSGVGDVSDTSVVPKPLNPDGSGENTGGSTARSSTIFVEDSDGTYPLAKDMARITVV
jgi:hypothetical protein